MGVSSDQSDPDRFVNPVNWKCTMKKVNVVAMLAAASADGPRQFSWVRSGTRVTIENIALVHGAFADGSG